MKVLVACEESQRVCTAFRDLGHEAYSCDIVPTSGDHPEWHFQCDVREMLDWGWDMIIVGLPKETQQIQPWQFGDPYTKLTYLWLKNLPQLIPTHNMKDIAVPWVNAGSKKADGTPRDKQGVTSPSRDRSKTFWGVARAMAQQFGGQV